MRVCLALPHNNRRISPQPYYLENLGIQHIASYLQSTGIDCRVVVADGADLSEEATLSAVMKNDPGLVGFSLSLDTSESVFRMCEILRQRHPQVMICLGGQHATFFARSILEHEPSVDFVVMGEGEETMATLCQSLATSDTSPELDKGLAYRRGSVVIATKSVLLRKDLDHYPNPDRSVLRILSDRGDYAMPMVLTSRGCPYQCTFCSSHDFFGGLWRTRNAQAVVDELELICENFGFTHFYFVDDQILGRGARDKNHLMGIVNEILRRNLHQRYGLYSFVMMRADFHQVLTDRELQRFRLAGFKDIFIGFESGSDEELRLFAKGFKRSSYANTMRLKSRFFIEGGFILFHPYTTVKALRRDADLIRQLGIPNWGYYSKRLVPYSGTQIFEKMKADGTLTECNYKRIRYEFQDDIVRGIYEAVTSIESEIASHDNRVFSVIDAYEKARLRDSAFCERDSAEFAMQFAPLRLHIQTLCDFCYDSFLDVTRDPWSVETQEYVIREYVRKSGIVLNEYTRLVHQGRLRAFM